MRDQESKAKLRRKKNKVVEFPEIPDKLYFSIGEVAQLCVIKPYVIRFWEQEFPVLKPAKLRCGRRYYCKDEILLIRTIRALLYEQGFTIEGARLQLQNKTEVVVQGKPVDDVASNVMDENSDQEKNYAGKHKLLHKIISHIDDILTFLHEVEADMKEVKQPVIEKNERAIDIGA